MAPVIASGVRLYGGVRLACESPVHFAPGVIAMSGMRIGAYSYFGERCLLGSAESIGRYCSFAPGVHLGLGKHPTHYLSTHPLFFRSGGPFPPESLPQGVGTPRSEAYVSFGPVIGHDVWVGAGAVILRGVRIGHGAVIGAGALVTEDVRPYAIVVGTPAKELRRRFDDALCDRLLALRWWDYDPALMAGVDVSDVAGCIDEIERRLRGSPLMHYPVTDVSGPMST